MSGEPKYILICRIDFDAGRDAKEVVIPYLKATEIVNILENAERKELRKTPILKGYRHRYHVDLLDSFGRDIYQLNVYGDICRNCSDRKYFSFIDDKREDIDLEDMVDEYLIDARAVRSDKDAIFIFWNNQEGKIPVMFSEWHPGIKQSESKIHRKVLEEV